MYMKKESIFSHGRIRRCCVRDEGSLFELRGLPEAGPGASTDSPTRTPSEGG